MPDTYTLLMALIADYCFARGWVPVGRRAFRVGPYTITVNGQAGEWQHIPAFHATVTRDDTLGVILVNPFRGSQAGGTRTFEDEAIAALREALGKETSR
jgi:hypothetical protein